MHTSCKFYFGFIVAILSAFGSCQNSSCPDAVDLSPYCTCAETFNFTVLTLDCSQVTNEDELEHVFTTATFPTLRITILKIWSNQDLKYLTRNVFGDVTFEQIDFNYVVIQYVDESTFLGSVNTLTLWRMNHCNLKEGTFPFYSLNSYSLLTSLEFSFIGKFEIFPKIASNSISSITFDNCEVQFLPNLVFNELPNLTNFILPYNNISSLTAGIFDTNPKLKRVWLTGNAIKTLETGTFKNLVHLTHLLLDKNKMTHLQTGSFYNLPSLEILYLDNNKLDHLHSFGNLTSLQSLSIYFNEVEFLEKYLLIGCTQLNLFDASWMNISLIEPGTFDHAPISGYLQLYENLLTTLNESWLRDALRNDNVVYLQNNPLECGCDMAWLYDDPALMTNIYAYCKNGTSIKALDRNFFINNC